MTIREVIIAIVCIIVVVALAKALLPSSRSRDASILKDQMRLNAFHKCFVIFSNDNAGIYPTPGLAWRSPDPVLGLAHGRGPENVSRNTTANLFSMCVAGRFFPVDFCIGPSEPSEHVIECPKYDYAAYDPAANVYWDTSFRADLHDVSHVSYAHIPIIGRSKLMQWRASGDPNAILMGNRGPISGKDDPKSITYRIHKPFDRWSGDIVFNDGSVKFFESMSPGGAAGGNFFAPPSGDVDDGGFLTFTKSIGDAGVGDRSGGGLTIEHD